MSQRQAKRKRQQARKEAYQNRINLVAELAQYWFYRMYPGADCVETEEEQAEMEAKKRWYLMQFWEMDEAQLRHSCDEMIADCMQQQGPMRNMIPKSVTV